MPDIPEYPSYCSIEPALQSNVENITQNYPAYADFSFLNLLAWDGQGAGKLSRHNGNLIARLPDYQGGSDLWTVLGDQEPDVTAAILLGEAEAETGERCLKLVPEVGALALEAAGFQLSEDRDNADYIISLPLLIERSGSKFRNLRQKVNRFVEAYGSSAEFDVAAHTDPETQKAALGIFDKREAEKSDNDAALERQALRRLFENAHLLDGIKMYGLRIEGKLAAFIVAEPHPSGTAIGHFWKADTEYKGIYGYFMTRIAEALLDQGVETLNIQQDLGIAGLRSNKLQLNPIGFLRKYTVTD